ncbi:MAG: DUF3325 family protein [Luteolibacter sp.]
MDPITLAGGFLVVVAFALGMKSHHKTLLNRDLTPRAASVFKAAGFLLILLLCWMEAGKNPLEIALAASVIALAMSGLVLTFLLASFPRGVAFLAGVSILALASAWM